MVEITGFFPKISSLLTKKKYSKCPFLYTFGSYSPAPSSLTALPLSYSWHFTSFVRVQLYFYTSLLQQRYKLMHQHCVYVQF